jgi:hypothetical protein
VSHWINRPARANGLKLTVRNNPSNGKEARIDRVCVAVTYHEP